MLSVITLSVITLSVITLSVIMLSVITLSNVAPSMHESILKLFNCHVYEKSQHRLTVS